MKVIGEVAVGRFTLILVFGGLMLLSLGSSPPVGQTQSVSPEATAVSDANSVFALNLLSKLPGQDANQVFSPFSISSVFAMVYGGARGTTESQIAAALQFPTNQPSLHAGMNGILSTLTNLNNRDVELNVENGLWSQSGYQIATGFVDLCRKTYGADIDPVDFRTGAPSALRRINGWAEKSTRGKIQNLFAPGSITPDTRLVLANAVYFKGKWARRFDKRMTGPMPFWPTPERKRTVPTMAQKSVFLYSSDDSAQVVELPYRGGEMSMLVLLPKTKDGLNQLEAGLSLNTLTNWLDRMHEAEVDLRLPKFKISSRFSLAQTLAGMGVRDAFDEARADFTGVTSERPFFISSIEHGAVVEVDEEGTVAAAATGASFGCSKRPESVTFHADHPFLFLILDRSTRTLLFVGKVTNPGA